MGASTVPHPGLADGVSVHPERHRVNWQGGLGSLTGLCLDGFGHGQMGAIVSSASIHRGLERKVLLLVSLNCQLDTAQSHLKRESQLKGFPDQTGFGHVYRGFF